MPTRDREKREFMSTEIRRMARLATLVAVAVCTLSAAAQQVPSLKDAYKGIFVVGAAINRAQITGQDSRGDAILASQFSSISPENTLKWESVHPAPDTYAFEVPDQD